MMAAAVVVVVVILEPRTTSSPPSSYEDNSLEHEDGVATRTDPSFRDEDTEASGDDRDEGSTRRLGCSRGFFGRTTRVRISFVRRGVGEASITALGRWTTVTVPSLLFLFLDDRFFDFFLFWLLVSTSSLHTDAVLLLVVRFDDEAVPTQQHKRLFVVVGVVVAEGQHNGNNTGRGGRISNSFVTT